MGTFHDLSSFFSRLKCIWALGFSKSHNFLIFFDHQTHGGKYELYETSQKVTGLAITRLIHLSFSTIVVINNVNLKSFTKSAALLDILCTT